MSASPAPWSAPGTSPQLVQGPARKGFLLKLGDRVQATPRMRSRIPSAPAAHGTVVAIMRRDLEGISPLVTVKLDNGELLHCDEAWLRADPLPGPTPWSAAVDPPAP